MKPFAVYPSPDRNAARFGPADAAEFTQAFAGLPELHHARIFLTGGTGFFGTWLLGSLLHAAHEENADVSVTVLTRRPEAFQKARPAFAHDERVQLWQGDVRDFAFPSGNFTHVIHAATDANATQNLEQPLLVMDTIVEGTRRVCEFMRHCKAGRLLLTSSGAAYGRQPLDMSHVSEDYMGAPDTTNKNAAYGEGKRLSESMACFYGRSYGFETVIARCFAFIGPYLPLGGTYAAGNFIQNALLNEPIKVGGDGTPLRSYLYGTDLAQWLWTLLVRGQKERIYNVGSDTPVSIADLAHLVAECADKPTVPVQIAKTPTPGVLPERYIPSVDRIKWELGLRPTVGLPEAIRRTLAWHRDRFHHAD